MTHRFPSDLQHPSVVRLLGLFRDGNEAYMVMEYVSKGSLLDVLKRECKQIEFKDQLDMYKINYGLVL